MGHYDDMPFLCGGYTQSDWDILNGMDITQDLMEYCDDYLDPIDRDYAIMSATKPLWA